MSEYYRTDLSSETPRTNHPGGKKIEVIGFNGFLWDTLIIRNLVAVPIASTRCQQSLETVRCFSFGK